MDQNDISTFSAKPPNCMQIPYCAADVVLLLLPVQLYLMASVIKTANIHISHFGYATGKTKKQN